MIAATCCLNAAQNVVCYFRGGVVPEHVDDRTEHIGQLLCNARSSCSPEQNEAEHVEQVTQSSCSVISIRALCTSASRGKNPQCMAGSLTRDLLIITSPTPLTTTLPSHRKEGEE